MGITAGDARELSLDALFPRFRALEAEHGSLVKALISAQRKVKKANKAQTGRLTSFRGGAGRLVDALRENLGEVVRTGLEVRRLEPQGAGYTLELSSGETSHADAVVLATPAFVSGALLSPFLPEAAAALSEIPYADVRVFGLGYDRVGRAQPAGRLRLSGAQRRGRARAGGALQLEHFPPTERRRVRSCCA